MLQNCVMRLLSGLGTETPTSNFLLETRSLSVQKIVAFQTLDDDKEGGPDQSASLLIRDTEEH